MWFWNGIVELDAREMKCEGRHTVHSNCLGVTGVMDRFVEKKHNTCPNCRHDFSDFFSTDIEANLEHRQPNGIEIIAHWSKPPNLRLAALNLLAQLPHETPLGHSTASISRLFGTRFYYIPRKNELKKPSQFSMFLHVIFRTRATSQATHSTQTVLKI